MVKKTLITLAYFLFFCFALAIFMPKNSLYFALEKELLDYKIIISQETLHEQILSLDIKNAEIYFDGVAITTVRTMHCTLLGIYNNIVFEDLNISSLAGAFIPPKVDQIILRYSIVNPLYIEGQAQGDFGKLLFHMSLSQYKLTAILQPSKLMLREFTNILREFKQEKNGEYFYEQTFQY